VIDAALAFLANELNAYLLARTGVSFGDAQLCRPVDDLGRWTVPEDHVGVTLLNVDEERVLKAQFPETVYVNGRPVTREPEIKLNLDILFAANFKQYPQALKFLSRVITFFQAHPRFSSEDYPALDPAIDTLIPELRSLGYEQLNQLWAFVGGKQLPSVVYRVRLVALQDVEPMSLGAPITFIDTTLVNR
jgi:hypothetical protein